MIMHYVYILPERLSAGFCFDGPVAIAFGNVDWFQAPEATPPEILRGYIEGKNYFTAGTKYLVLSPDQNLSFTFDA